MAPSTKSPTIKQQQEHRKKRSFSCTKTVAANQPNQTLDGTYQNEMKQFKEFVDSKRASGALQEGDGSKYLTRENADLYFGEMEAHQKKMKTANAQSHEIERSTLPNDIADHRLSAESFQTNFPNFVAAPRGWQKQNLVNCGGGNSTIERFPMYHERMVLKQRFPGYESWAAHTKDNVWNNLRLYGGHQTTGWDPTHAFNFVSAKLDGIAEKQNRNHKELLVGIQSVHEKAAHCMHEINWLKNFPSR